MKCRICKDSVKKVYDTLGSRTQLEIPIYQCDACNAYFSFPPETDYSMPNNTIIDYYKKSKAGIEARHESISNFVTKEFLPYKGKFLDVGCGIGYSLRILKERGWQAIGIEPSETLAQYAKKNINDNVIEGFFSEELISKNSELSLNSFDFILIDNVLEHVNHPIDFIRLASTLLNEKGVLVIAVPPVDWFRRLLIKSKFIRNNLVSSSRINLFYDVEQHVNYFSRKSIERLILESNVGLKLTSSNVRYHHSSILNGRISRMLNFETGYFFITK